MTILDDRPYQLGDQQRSLPGYSIKSPSYKARNTLYRHKDGRLISGSGGDLEVIHPLELERSQHTGMPVRVTEVKVFGGRDVVQRIIAVEKSEHLIIQGSRLAALVHSHQLYEGTAVNEDRILKLPGTIISLDVEKHGKTELLLSFLLDFGLFHYALSIGTDTVVFQCLQCYKCTRTIQSGLLWRDGDELHIAYYDGFVRVGVVSEDYEDMLLIQRLSYCRNNVNVILDVLVNEINRLVALEDSEKDKRTEMLNVMHSLQGRILTNGDTVEASAQQEDDEQLYAAHLEFTDLKMQFKNHSMRADRVSHRLTVLRKLLTLTTKAIDANILLDKSIATMEQELEELSRLSVLLDECIESESDALIEKSRLVFEEKKYAVTEMFRKTHSGDIADVIADWDRAFSAIVETLNGSQDTAKDMRFIISQHIYEHRADKKDRFTHFLLDQNAKDVTLYCMSGLTTLAVYPRKGRRAASITLDASYETSLTAAALMTGTEGVYVTDEKGVFPIYFYREKRYFDAGHPISLPSFDAITSILMEPEGMILGSSTGGLLHLAFDMERSYEHFIIASSIMAHPFSHGRINCLKLIPTGDSLLAIHCSDLEVTISERDIDRWHRVTFHMGGAHCLAVTPFCLDHRGAFIVVGSRTFVRLKALQYTDDNLLGLHDLGESRVYEDNGKEVEVNNVSLDPTMEFRSLPCKLRYAVGYADKAIRTYVALLTGQHDFTVTEKFIAQIEPLHNVNQMICFHGRPMGCYAAFSKTLQVWNDLDRHQQKKMKSERMELHKMEVAITALDRVEGRSCYLLIGYRDSRVQIMEERGRGTGKIETVGYIEDCHPESEIRPVTVLRTRVISTSRTDRLFIHSLAGSDIFVHTALIEAGKLFQASLVLKTSHSIFSATSFDVSPLKPCEMMLFGVGIAVHRLNDEEKRKLEEFREFEF